MIAFRSPAARGRRHRGMPGSESSVRPSVELHIEELVLHGFSPVDRYTIGDAIQRELTRLIATHGMPGLEGKGFSADRLDAGSFQVRKHSREEDVGIKVAESVYRGLHR